LEQEKERETQSAFAEGFCFDMASPFPFGKTCCMAVNIHQAPPAGKNCFFSSSQVSSLFAFCYSPISSIHWNSHATINTIAQLIYLVLPSSPHSLSHAAKSCIWLWQHASSPEQQWEQLS
jgi:hypothetical protein